MTGPVRAALERRPPAWLTADEMTLTDIQALWGRWYDTWFEDGTWHARHVLDDTPLEADTPAGLESAIRAHRWRDTRGVR